MVRKITLKGQPVLHARAQEVDPKEIPTPAFQQLIADMVESMYAHNGVGIAATQIGIGKRIFIAESPKGPIALINPVFTEKSWKQLKGEEGCLSVPGQFDHLRRHKTVKIEGLTANGQPISFVANDFFARVLQHEMDHLDGTLYVDRVEQQKAEKEKKKGKK